MKSCCFLVLLLATSFLFSCQDETEVKSILQDSQVTISLSGNGEILKVDNQDTIIWSSGNAINLNSNTTKVQSWEVKLLKSDEDSVASVINVLSDQAVSVKLPKPGLYEIIYKNRQQTTTIYFKCHGVPGKDGDNILNDYAFRFTKNSDQVYLYIKSPITEYANQYKFGLVFDKNQKFYILRGYYLEARNFLLTRCSYSPDYLKLSFSPKEMTDNSSYHITYFIGDYQNELMIPAASKSSFFDGDTQIVF